jgi:hypothetical protein
VGAVITRAALASVLLVVVGVGLGTRLDVEPPRTPTYRGGYRVLEVDLHAHTRFADGLLSPFDLVLQARRRGLDALAITDHNILFPAQLGRWFSRRTGGPTILVGEEVTTRRYHLHGVGLTERIRAGDPLADVIFAVHAQGGLVIAAHPVRPYWPSFEAEIDGLDGAEVMHPIAWSGSEGWRWEDLRDFFDRERAMGHELTAIGSSDYHGFSVLGLARTLVFARGDDEAAVMDALRSGRTVVFDRHARAYGDPRLIDLLQREPYAMREQDYGYRGSGWLDRAARALGWLGVVGLVVLRRRRDA